MLGEWGEVVVDLTVTIDDVRICRRFKHVDESCQKADMLAHHRLKCVLIDLVCIRQTNNVKHVFVGLKV